VVGIKPTVGLVPSQGIIPESRHLDTAGSFARTVRDAALVLDAMTGQLEKKKENESDQSYRSMVTGKSALAGARFGMPWKRVWERAAQDEAMENHDAAFKKLFANMKSAGATINRVDFPSAEAIIPDYGWDW